MSTFNRPERELQGGLRVGSVPAILEGLENRDALRGTAQIAGDGQTGVGGLHLREVGGLLARDHLVGLAGRAGGGDGFHRHRLADALFGEGCGNRPRPFQ